ncbi:MAG: hypothetical protein HC938_12150, partial [Nitrospira sp.]|nr:hypothetical protein [Nitrospira sp.]
MESYEKDFSSIYVHMVRAGEASGALDQILFRLAEFLEKQPGSEKQGDQCDAVSHYHAGDWDDHPVFLHHLCRAQDYPSVHPTEADIAL